MDKSDKDREKRVGEAMEKVETNLFCQFVAFALNSFNAAFQTSANKIGTLQKDVCNLLRGFLSNFIRPELLAAAPDDQVHTFDYENVSYQLSNDVQLLDCT